MTTTEPRTYPFNVVEALDLDPIYARLRAQEPLSRVKLPYGEEAWLATRYEDVKAVLGDPRFSRAETLQHDEPRLRPRQQTGGILSMDPPDHTRLRRLVAKAFTQRRVEKLRPRTQEIADGLVDGMIERGGPADLVEEFALPLPIAVICELLGVPFEDRERFRVWSDAFLSTNKLSPEQVTDYMDRMMDYIAGLIAQRRAQPADDLITGLIAARDEQDKLSEDEMVRLAAGILVAGHETTASQIPNFLHVLLTHPDQLERLRADLDCVPAAVEELLRFVPLGVGAGFARYATEDVELGGVLVRAGEPVLSSVGSANRDEAIFENPDELDLARAEASHVGFGHGPHHCLGAQLARLELQVALRTLLTRLPGLGFPNSPEADVAWKTGLLVRGPRRMVVSWQGVR
ncbi:cytochrome P450 [Saccharopolyspora dendranthemae]|uniref:Cytochrome P450 n=1 Tax=Saccharopolyspora dendranthemae TaxID=1181886 RepID=A0A561U2V4_9PSEU|nr:cytochrome P450 [Saccharopolyspora dendranthemae]TWF93692.1 cytochrome P450 [Saccharopolyspora dendranthemae]